MPSGSVTVSFDNDQRGYRKIALAWVSDASGNVDVQPAYRGDSLNGAILAVAFKPDSGGTQPTDFYDAQYLDSLGVNLLDPAGDSNIGDDLSNTTATQRCLTQGGAPAPSLCVGEAPRLVISNAGNAKGGTVVLYVKQ